MTVTENQIDHFNSKSRVFEHYYDKKNFSGAERNHVCFLLEKHFPPNTQLKESAFLLLANNKITRKSAMLDASILNFPAMVNLLRSRGAEIETNTVERKNKFGRRITYGEYQLIDCGKMLKLFLWL